MDIKDFLPKPMVKGRPRETVSQSEDSDKENESEQVEIEIREDESVEEEENSEVLTKRRSERLHSRR